MKAVREVAGRRFDNNIAYAKINIIKSTLDVFGMN